MAKTETTIEKDKIPDQSEVTVDDKIYLESSMRDHFFRPAVICGICEACGSSHYLGGEVVKKPNPEGLNGVQHSLKGGRWENIDATICPHYKSIYEHGQSIKCSYCNEEFTGLKNTLGKFKELLASRIVYVMSFTSEPNKLIMYCDSFECREKHIKRMRSNNSNA